MCPIISTCFGVYYFIVIVPLIALFYVIKHGYFMSVEMAEKVVCLAAVGRAPWTIFLRLLCRPELQAAQGHYQFRFMWTGKFVKHCVYTLAGWHIPILIFRNK